MILLMQRYGLMVLGWLTIAGTVLAVLFGARNAGRKAEQVEQLKKSLEIRNAQIKATLSAPRSRAELVERLHNGTF